ncbi:MAG: long-chain fatty acid--CoA ligase [Salinisphaeraceae bacterium]|nr:long-chain fatty acid--CoA ligase [Salinisphaeraceae bacterium]
MHIAQFVFRAAQLNGKGAATEFQGTSYSWSETADRMQRIAAALQGLGIQVNQRVAILSVNSRLYFESLFAVPHMGGIVVPLNIRWAKPEFAYSLSDSGSNALIFDQTFLPMVEDLRGEDTPVEHYLYTGEPGDCPDWAQPLETLLQQAEPLQDSLHADKGIAGIFYTGGTTGFPKGVVQTHTALFSSAINTVAVTAANQTSTCLHAAPMFHMADLALVFMFTMLASRHVIIPAFEPILTMNTIKEHGVTHTVLVPAMIQMMFDHPDFDPAAVASLQGVIYGGSPMQEGILRRVMNALPGIQMMQAYGQTELAPVATILMPEDHVLDGERSKLLRSAGRAAYSVQIKIIDEQGNRVPTGEVGEVCVSGPNNMLGYWEKPEATEKALVDGWVHTGDAGRMDEEGYLFIVDRVKDMVVTGGENVFTAEVETALSTHPDVAQVAVIGIPHDEWGEAVHAIVIPTTDAARDEAAIIAHCKEQIAGYKCPKSIEFREDPFPLSGAGKVLKRELRAPFWEGRERQVN